MILDHLAYAEDVLFGFIVALYESGLDLPAQGKVEEVAASFIRGLPETSDDDARATTRDAKFWTLEKRRQSAEEKIHALACPVLAMPTRAAATLEEAVAQASEHAADARESLRHQRPILHRQQLARELRNGRHRRAAAAGRPVRGHARRSHTPPKGWDHGTYGTRRPAAGSVALLVIAEEAGSTVPLYSCVHASVHSVDYYSQYSPCYSLQAVLY